MSSKKIQMSESLFLASLLAVVGGFLDAYSYILRGGVFANAQTGNIALLGISIHKRDPLQALYYLVPILAFGVGIVVVQVVRKKYKGNDTIHWRQGIVVLEALLLAGVAFIPLGELNVFANIGISFVCAMQVDTFTRVHGHPFASTMCTGNLRSGTEALVQYVQSGDKALRTKGLKYYRIILFFIVGAALGSVFCQYLGKNAILVCAGLLVVAAVLMKKEYKNC